MEIIVRGHHVGVPERFRQLATAKLAKLAKLDQKAMRIDVEISKERNSRQADRRERVELTIRSRGPAIRAEAAAADRYTAFDLAFAKLESRLRRVSDRRKVKQGAASVRAPGMLADVPADLEDVGMDAADLSADASMRASANGLGHIESLDLPPMVSESADADADADADGQLVPIQMEGDGPLVVREKVHTAKPMAIDQALYEMELVGHDFFLFHDSACDRFSVVYRRRGYDYGVIRLIEE